MRLPIYLDYMATTPIDSRVKAKMCECLTIDGIFGNASSKAHIYGCQARDNIELARAQVAKLINAEHEEIIWTSGATEANNLAIKGAAHFYQRKGKHIITCKTEHKSVLNVCRYLETEGYEITYLPVNQYGLIDLNQLADAIRSDTVLVSVMHVNNEIGVIQDIAAIAALIKPHGIVFHVDAVQSVGKLPLDVKQLPVDLMSFSAHKAYGPKGIGALYIRHKPRIRLTPQIHGGGHEFGLRSGTLPTHQIVGMGEAFQILSQEGLKDCQRVKILRDKLWRGIASLGDVYLNGDMENRAANNLNVSFDYIKCDNLADKLDKIAVTATSACISESVEPSHALMALGIINKLALNSIRFSLGRYTTEEEIDYAIEHISEVITKLRK